MISVIGDVMLDEFWFGNITRTSPESEGTPVVHIKDKKAVLGGAANVALNISKLGEQVSLSGIVGYDHYKDIIIQLLKDENISFNYVIDKSINTTRKIRVYNGDSYLYRADIEDCAKDYQKDLQVGLANEYVVISDYAKGAIKDAQKIITKHKYTFVDPKASLEHYKNAFVLKPNFKEFIDWSNLSVESSIEDFIYTNYFDLVKIRKKLNVQNLIITAGSEGCILITEKIRLFKAPKVEEADVTGAGDSFLAGLVCKYKQTTNIIEAIKFANLVASIAVSKKGTSYVKSNEI